jgi:hypothetical protein
MSIMSHTPDTLNLLGLIGLITSQSIKILGIRINGSSSGLQEVTALSYALSERTTNFL